MGGSGTVANGIVGELVETEFVLPAAISVELVGATGGRRMAGSLNENVAAARENRSGAGPIRCK